MAHDFKPMKKINIGIKSQRKFPLPLMTSVFEYKRNALEIIHHARLLELVNWFRQYCDMDAKTVGGCLFASYFYPCCTNVERFETAFLVMLASFAIDDHAEYKPGDDGAKLERSVNVWRDFQAGLDRLISDEYIPIGLWNPSVLCMHSLMENIANTFNESQKRRFVALWKKSADSLILEVNLHKNKTMFHSVDEYIEVRVWAIGIQAFTQLIEYTDDIVLTDDEWNDIHFQHFMRLVEKDSVFLNDFYSFEKEYYAVDGDISAMFNLVAVIMMCDKCEANVAMDRVVKMVFDIESEIQSIIKIITGRSDCKQSVKAFVEKACYIISANMGCCLALDRYNMF